MAKNLHSLCLTCQPVVLGLSASLVSLATLLYILPSFTKVFTAYPDLLPDISVVCNSLCHEGTLVLARYMEGLIQWHQGTRELRQTHFSSED